MDPPATTGPYAPTPPPPDRPWAPSAPAEHWPARSPVAMIDEAPVRGTRAIRFARTPWYAKAWVVIFAVTALGGGVRFYHLSFPHGYVFDEVYYAKDGCLDAGYPFKACNLQNPSEQTVTVHPPLGREAIALSIRLFGNRSFGWRFGSAFAGTLTVFMVALMAYKLWGSALLAGLAGLLLSIENLNLVQSRISMLDIFVAMWVVAGFLFIVLDRRWIERRTPPPVERTDEELLFGLPPDSVPSPVLRPWRIAAGVAFGAAAATKWSGGTALVGAIVLTLAWERTRRSDTGVRHAFLESLRDEAFGIFVFLVLLPLLVYVGSYYRWFAHNGFDVHGWLTLQKGMATFSLNLRATHPYASPAWKWVLMLRPVAYYYQCPVKTGSACQKAVEILGMGNPVIFWATVATVPYALIAWIRKRDWRAGFVFVAIGIQYFPWFLTSRTSFLFYMTPVTPFMVLALVYALRDISKVPFGVRGRTLAPLSAVVVSLVLAMFVFFWPVLVGQTLSFSAWQLRAWIIVIAHHTILNWV